MTGKGLIAAFFVSALATGCAQEGEESIYYDPSPEFSTSYYGGTLPPDAPEVTEDDRAAMAAAAEEEELRQSQAILDPASNGGLEAFCEANPETCGLVGLAALVVFAVMVGGSGNGGTGGMTITMP